MFARGGSAWSRGVSTPGGCTCLVPGGCLLRRVYLPGPGGGVCSGEGYLPGPGGVSAPVGAGGCLVRYSPPVNRMNDRQV